MIVGKNADSAQQTNRYEVYYLNNGNLYAPRYDKTFNLHLGKNELGRFAPSALLHYYNT